MGQETKIAWTDHTANFWWGCQRVSPGCEHCYAEHLAVVRRKLPVWGPPSTTKRERKKGVWKEVPKWNQAAREAGVRRRMFVSSMADIFEDHPDVTQWRADALVLLETCTDLDVQLLTKRPQNIMQMVPASWHTAWPKHIWIGTTVEDQRRAEERIPHLLRVPAAVRFLSCEPLLEPVDLRTAIGGMARHEREGHAANCDGACFELPTVQWVIVGGESGPGARPFDLAWARNILRQCAEAGVACFVKQLGAMPHLGDCCTKEGDDMDERGMLRGDFLGGPASARIVLRDRAGADSSEWPEDLRVQQFPSADGP